MILGKEPEWLLKKRARLEELAAQRERTKLYLFADGSMAGWSGSGLNPVGAEHRAREFAADLRKGEAKHKKRFRSVRVGCRNVRAGGLTGIVWYVLVERKEEGESR